MAHHLAPCQLPLLLAPPAFSVAFVFRFVTVGNREEAGWKGLEEGECPASADVYCRLIGLGECRASRNSLPWPQRGRRMLFCRTTYTLASLPWRLFGGPDVEDTDLLEALDEKVVQLAELERFWLGSRRLWRGVKKEELERCNQGRSSCRSPRPVTCAEGSPNALCSNARVPLSVQSSGVSKIISEPTPKSGAACTGSWAVAFGAWLRITSRKLPDRSTISSICSPHQDAFGGTRGLSLSLSLSLTAWLAGVIVRGGAAACQQA